MTVKCNRASCNRVGQFAHNDGRRGLYCCTCAILINKECRRFNDPNCFDLPAGEELRQAMLRDREYINGKNMSMEVHHAEIEKEAGRKVH